MWVTIFDSAECRCEACACRLFGSYEALAGGQVGDALVDFTGGIGYRIDLTKKRELPRDLFARLQIQDNMSTLMGCSINVSLLCLETRRLFKSFAHQRMCGLLRY